MTALRSPHDRTASSMVALQQIGEQVAQEPGRIAEWLECRQTTLYAFPCQATRFLQRGQSHIRRLFILLIRPHRLADEFLLAHDIEDVIRYLKMFDGHVIIQTMFMHGDGTDNVSEYYVAPWLEAVKDIQPEKVMVYTIDRETPDKLLAKATHEELDAIKARVEALGIKCTASY